YIFVLSFFFFFSSRRRHTRSKRDWSSDVCSSDLFPAEGDLRWRRRMDRAQVRRRGDGRPHLTVGDEPDERRHRHEQPGTHQPEAWLDQRGMDRLPEAGPTLLVITYVDQHADEHRRHVLEHHAL